MKKIQLNFEVETCGDNCPFLEKFWQSKVGNRYTYNCKLTNANIEKLNEIHQDCPLPEDEVYEYPNVYTIKMD
jgi:hypothetical protein